MTTIDDQVIENAIRSAQVTLGSDQGQSGALVSQFVNGFVNGNDGTVFIA